jgi:hypothetical protein
MMSVKANVSVDSDLKSASGGWLVDKTGHTTNKALLNHLYDVALLQLLSEPLPDTKIVRYLPVSFYSDLDFNLRGNLEPLTTEIFEFIAANGFELVAALDAEEGTYRRKGIYKTQNKLTQAEFDELTERVTQKVKEGLQAGMNQKETQIEKATKFAELINKTSKALKGLVALATSTTFAFVIGGHGCSFAIDPENPEPIKMECTFEKTDFPKTFECRNKTKEMIIHIKDNSNQQKIHPRSKKTHKHKVETKPCAPGEEKKT